ncbi:uncharacterized protein CPUR_05406 [Claviceps purpurea 20.1]|uniref:Uncharacterized protein n=1 Tax=Claviceps purpurea (strain 20.1) TaxID=1111077 RepID=M1WCE2_CLAP2|nr:uncharacterized protein CPUR_05406 [Claviceps purpurea 20.1]
MLKLDDGDGRPVPRRHVVVEIVTRHYSLLL